MTETKQVGFQCHAPGTPGTPFQPELGRAANSLAPGGEGPRAPPGEPLQTRWPSQGRGCCCRRSWHPHPDTHMAAAPCRPHRRRRPDVGLRTRASSRARSGSLSDGPCAESFGSTAAVPGTESPPPARLPLAGQGGLHRRHTRTDPDTFRTHVCPRRPEPAGPVPARSPGESG